MHQDLENIINVALDAGPVTPRQREIIINKAKSLGIDETEAEIYLDSKINERLEKAEKKSSYGINAKKEWVAEQLKAGLKKADELSGEIGIKRKGKLYRKTEKKWLLGICSGIADYYGISSNVVRAVLATAAFVWVIFAYDEFFSLFWCFIPVIIYIVLAFVIPKENSKPENND